MIVARIGGMPLEEAEIDRREAALRAGMRSSALPRVGTSEGRQLRRWLTQLAVTERVVQLEAAERGLTAGHAPAESELLPDVAARLEVGSIAAAALALPVARSLFFAVTADVDVDHTEIAAYHRRNPLRFARQRDVGNGWRTTPSTPIPLTAARDGIAEQLRGAARRRHFRQWLDERRAALVVLSDGYEHPGDPRQPDNTHRH